MSGKITGPWMKVLGRRAGRTSPDVPRCRRGRGWRRDKHLAAMPGWRPRRFMVLYDSRHTLDMVYGSLKARSDHKTRP